MTQQLKIPLYPTFTPFSFDYKDDYEAIYNKYEPYSEFYFANLAVWLNLNSNLELSKLNNNLILKFSSPDEPDKSLYGVYGDELIDETFNKILLQKQPLGTNPTKIDIVPEFTLNALMEKSRFNISEDRDNWEYVYSTDKHTKMAGKFYFKNRYIVKKFIRDFGQDIKIIDSDLTNKSEVKKLSIFYDGLNNGEFVSNNDESKSEATALANTFKYADKLYTKCLVLHINNKISGFVTFYLVHDKIALVNHLKADYKYKNIFDFLTYVLASKVRTKSAMYFNYEQDLGIEGLRFHKMKLRPKKFLKKYTVSLKI